MKTTRTTIRLLREFSADSAELGVSELSRRLSLDRATVHRILRTLVEERIVSQDTETRLYRLGSGVLELARNFLQQQGIVQIAQPHLDALRDTTGETVGLKLLDGRETVCLATAEGHQPVRVSYYIGERMPLHCTASGILYLAYMSAGMRRSFLSSELTKFTDKTVVDAAKIEAMAEAAKRKGIAISDETYMAGTRSISAPVLLRDGTLAGVVTILAPGQRITGKILQGMTRPLRATAEAIASDIQRIGPGANMSLPKR